MKCKIINTEINPFMSFGKMPLANGFLNKNSFKNEFFFNLEVGFSDKISLFQINDHPKPVQMFNEKYPFFTGSSEFMKIHFKEYSNWIKKYLNSNSKLIEIGSNDGTFLSNFKGSNIESIGFEPSKNVSDIANANRINSINSFFDLNTIENLKKFHKNTDAICAANVICHVPNLNNLIQSIDELLNEKGVFIFEEPYLGSVLEKGSYDQIYDEHIFIFSATSIQKIFSIYDMELIDAIPQITHGGSMRYIISRKNKRKINKNLNKILDKEKVLNIDNSQCCKKFKNDCETSKINLQKKLKKLKDEGNSICGYAATSKSTTVLNYCNIGVETIDFICDTTKEKINKFSPGMHIPIVDMNHFKNNHPDIAFLFAWNHKDEIFKKEKTFSKSGKWISHVEL